MYTQRGTWWSGSEVRESGGSAPWNVCARELLRWPSFLASRVSWRENYRRGFEVDCYCCKALISFSPSFSSSHTFIFSLPLSLCPYFETLAVPVCRKEIKYPEPRPHATARGKRDADRPNRTEAAGERRRRRSEGEEGLRTIPEVLLPCGEEVFGQARVSLLSFRNSLLFIGESYVVLATKGGLDGLYNAQIFFFFFFLNGSVDIRG